MNRKGYKQVLAAGLLLLLTGCFSQSVDELYAQPKAPDDYVKLDNKINEVLSQGGEYAAPLSGELTQKVQLQDLDGDGVQEAIAFFRVSSEERPLKIYIYRQVGDEYEVAAIIESAGTAINSVYYENLDDSPTKEIIVSWQASDKIHSLVAYSIEDYHVLELMRTNYDDFLVYDLDADEEKEILVLQAEKNTVAMLGDGHQKSQSWVELYDMQDGILELNSAAPLSDNTTALAEDGLQTGLLRDGKPALFVTSIYGKNDNGYITDIFAWKDQKLQNVTLEHMKPEHGQGDALAESTSTIRWQLRVTGTDINGDGIMELPSSYELPELSSTGGAPNFWSIRWRQYDSEGKAYPVFNTYYNDRDGWYFILPDAWEGKVALSRSDMAGGGERAVNFYYWDGSEDTEPVLFLTIYKLTGDNRFMRAKLPDRFQLPPTQGDDSDALYAASLYSEQWDCGLDKEGVKANFALITSGWSIDMA